MSASLISSPSPKSLSPAYHYSKTMVIISGVEHPEVSNQQKESLHGSVAILWDIENCPVPSDVRPEDVAGNIRLALRVHPVIKGAVTMFSAYGDFNAFPWRLRDGCQKTGVKLVDVPNGRKDAADKAILVDMFLFALDHRPPSSIMLISGDVDFAPALHILGQRGYTVILVIPARVGVSSALSNAGRFLWDWPSIARGEGFIPPKTSGPLRPDLAGYLMSSSVRDKPASQNEEANVYRGTSQRQSNNRGNADQLNCYDPPHTSHDLSEYSSNNLISGLYIGSSKSQGLPSGSSDCPQTDRITTQEQTWWVRPGDVQGLKSQLVRLLEMSSGTLPLVHVPSQYLKIFRRPLYVAEYGACKLVNLIHKMADAFLVVGKGHRKILCLRNSADRRTKKLPSTAAVTRKGNSILEETVISTCLPLHSSSNELSDEERNVKSSILDGEHEIDDHLSSFKQEVQELLVCYSCSFPLSAFGPLYEQRYKKAIDCQSFGVNQLEELIDKVKDVVHLLEDQVTKKKYLISCSVGG
ncbi:uncharacterized protein [Typha latifolia]|uniref:uncharacterized protein n=1 Tax=Typha latifolia TaxID=4733 RepID=UPI003C2E0723